MARKILFMLDLTTLNLILSELIPQPLILSSRAHFPKPYPLDAKAAG
jgi:hypothetical protein